MGLWPTALLASDIETFTPEMFGAKGDGRTNDTRAFQALSDRINSLGGGRIILRKASYVVGNHNDAALQSGRGSEFAFPPGRVLQLVKCRDPVIVHGNGARLVAAKGLRFGSFDPRTGRPFETKMPFTNRSYRASPYFAMIEVLDCSGPIEITDLELDGNLAALEIGGKWGDAGRQIPGSGILLSGNSGPERLSRIYSHHHPLDGLKIEGPNERSASSLISNVTSEFNARQGCSLTGGRNYDFAGCRFRHTGRGTIKSAPKAGVDIEPGREHIARNIRFTRCEFSNNDGAGLIANEGDSSGVTFESCYFVGTTNWSAWPKKPLMQFNNCTFLGAIINAFGDPDAARAAQFYECKFIDDPALSPTRQVYCDETWNRSIAVLRRSANVLFSGCEFRLTHQCTLPWSRNDVIFTNCRMSQRTLVPSRPRGIYRGTNIISGNVDIEGSTIAGDVILNGRRLR